MKPTTKKLIGTIATLIWLAFYVMVAAAIGGQILRHANWFVAFAFYALAGTLWIVPIGLMFPWMHREPR
jgi:hypothetical protein